MSGAHHTGRIEPAALVPERPDSPQGHQVLLQRYTSEEGFEDVLTGWYEDEQTARDLLAFWMTGGAAVVLAAAELEPAWGDGE